MMDDGGSQFSQIRYRAQGNWYCHGIVISNELSTKVVPNVSYVL